METRTLVIAGDIGGTNSRLQVRCALVHSRAHDMVPSYGIWTAALLFFCLKRYIQVLRTTACTSCCRHSLLTPGTSFGDIVLEPP